MEADAGLPIKELRVDGGATANNLLMQFQANLLGCKVTRPHIVETTALGAAYLAGLAVGYWENVEEIQQQWQSERDFTPAGDASEVAAAMAEWKRAVSATQSWSQGA